MIYKRLTNTKDKCNAHLGVVLILLINYHIKTPNGVLYALYH
jgi:hypothetical protein